MRNGFTLIELLIVITILGVLGVMVLTAINPLEIINRARDTATYNVASEIYQASIRSLASIGSSPWKKDFFEVLLGSQEGKDILSPLVTNGEIKASFVKSSKDKLSAMYISSAGNLSFLAVCFQPLSNQFKKSRENIYNLRGEVVGDCSNKNCITCIANATMVGQDLADSGGVTTVNDVSVPAYCSNFNPERPDYPWTCNYSNKYSQYGCTNYCVTDLGCNSGCPDGQRKLTKSYYAVLKGAAGSAERAESEGPFALCLSHWRDINSAEEYCVSGEAAGCDVWPYRSYTSQFEWGCTNPRRPYKWIENASNF